MNKKDIPTIIVVAIVSAAFSIFVSNLLISPENNREEKAEVIPVISSDFERPPAEYFNSSSINPTQTIQIGEENDSQPFGNNQ